jgi:hypothetical protein
MGLLDRLWYDGNVSGIRHDHTYRSKLTGESFDVESVGTQIVIRRLDAKNTHQVSIEKSVLDGALRDGYVEHDDVKCDCTNNV